MGDIEVTEQFLANRTVDTDTWYNDFQKIGQAGYEWRGFSKFAEANRPTNETAEEHDVVFFILGAKIGDRLSEIDIYNNGLLVTNNFTVPPELGEVLRYEVEIRQLNSNSEKPTNVFQTN